MGSITYIRAAPRSCSAGAVDRICSRAADRFDGVGEVPTVTALLHAGGRLLKLVLVSVIVGLWL